MDLSIRIWGALAVPVSVLFTTLFNRRQKNKLDNTDSTSRAMTAITEANVELTELMRSAMAPLQTQITAQDARIERQSTKITKNDKELHDHRKQLRQHQKQLSGFRTWALELRAQVVALGGDPTPPPPEVDTSELDGFNID